MAREPAQSQSARPRDPARPRPRPRPRPPPRWRRALRRVRAKALRSGSDPRAASPKPCLWRQPPQHRPQVARTGLPAPHGRRGGWTGKPRRPPLHASLRTAAGSSERTSPQLRRALALPAAQLRPNEALCWQLEGGECGTLHGDRQTDRMFRFLEPARSESVLTPARKVQNHKHSGPSSSQPNSEPLYLLARTAKTPA